MIVGHDFRGVALCPGDICEFELDTGTAYTPDYLLGMIVYDEDSYAYAFETLNDYAPLICMYAVDPRTIVKKYDKSAVSEVVPDLDAWRVMYLRHFGEGSERND